MSSESPPTLEREECAKILDTLLNNASTPKKKLNAVRNHCMAVLMLDAGLRVGELVQLQWSDLYFNELPVRTIFIKPHMTKNKVERSIPVSHRLSTALDNYLESGCSLHPDFDCVFAFTNFSTKRPLTTRQVERIICAAGWTALGRPVHPHVLRHTFATRLMRVTNISTVQKILGHKYLSSTQVYCHPNEEDKRQAIEAASHPEDQVASPEKQQPEHPEQQQPERPGPQPASPSAHQPASRW